MGQVNATRRKEIDSLRRSITVKLDESKPGVWVVLRRYNGEDRQAPYRDYRAVMSGGFDRKKYLLKAHARQGGQCQLLGMRLGGY